MTHQFAADTVTTELSWPAEELTQGRSLDLGNLRRLTGGGQDVTARRLLGGTKVLGKLAPETGDDPLLWDGYIHAGMPAAAFKSLRQYFRASQTQLLGLLGVPERTMQRQLSSKDKAILDVDAAARLLALALVVQRSVDVMGSPEAADQWLSTPNAALGGKQPLGLAGRPLGTQAVLDVLNSIEHGMFA